MVTMSEEDMESKGGDNTPQLNIQLIDTSHKGVHHFLQLVESSPHRYLSECFEMVKKALYSEEARAAWISRREKNHLSVPKVRSITLYVRPMEGIAYTTGTILDDEHKEIHLSADYVQKQFQKPKTVEPSPTSTQTAASATPTVAADSQVATLPAGKDRYATAAREIQGVIVHEVSDEGAKRY
jgi:hypothetical protein